MRKEIILKKEDFGPEFEGKYVFETLSWGTANQISSDCTKIETASRKTTIDLKELQGRMLDATMIERPLVITLDKLTKRDGIPMALGEFLMAIADQVNGYGKEDRERIKNLGKRCGLEPDIQT